MDNVGWIKLYRALRDNSLWISKKPFDERSAWIDMLLEASYEDALIKYKGAKVNLKTGQFPASTRDLSARWNWNVAKVNRFIHSLEQDGMITISPLNVLIPTVTGDNQKVKQVAIGECNTNCNADCNSKCNTIGSVVTIVNYGFFQGEVVDAVTPIVTQDVTGSVTESVTPPVTEVKQEVKHITIKNKENKELKESNNKESNNIKDIITPLPPSGFCKSKTNLENVKAVLETYPIDYERINQNSKLLESVKEWMEYKDERLPHVNNHYGTEMGVKKLLNKILRLYDANGTDYVIESINDSIASNYQGIIFKEIKQAKAQRNILQELADVPDETWNGGYYDENQ